MPVDPLDFGVDVSDVRDRIEALAAFTLVGDIQSATDAIEGRIPFNPPAAFVSIVNEQAEANKITGGFSQRVTVRASVLFCIRAQRAADDRRDQMERARKALMRQLVNWTARGAGGPFGYDRYLLRRTGDGLCWGEVLFLTSYRFTQ